jgi:hypothetical protein
VSMSEVLENDSVVSSRLLMLIQSSRV